MLDPALVIAFLDDVRARGIFVDPARVRSPKDKPRVENQVPFVRESWSGGETFTDIERPTMLPPPDSIYNVPLYVEKAKVHPDHHIQVAQALYSVPAMKQKLQP